jgi:hypothetical protein
VQGADTVGFYYTKLKKIARLANMGDDEFYRRFIDDLTSDNQLEVRRMGLHKPINEILSTLEEIERYKSDLATGINPTLQAQPPSLKHTLLQISIELLMKKFRQYRDLIFQVSRHLYLHLYLYHHLHLILNMLKLIINYLH